jgi:hypothetical protein
MTKHAHFLMLCSVAAALPFDGASWIAPSVSIPNGTFAAYRADVTLKSSCKNVSVALAVDTKYWLFINGKMVVWEGGLKRGPEPGAGYFDSLDLSTAGWTEGQNAVAILALYLGRRTVPPSQPWWNNEHSDSGVHALLFAGDMCGTPLVSDASWRAVPHPAYSNDFMSDLRPNFRASEPDIVFDSSVTTLKGWTSPTFDDTAWPMSVSKGSPGDAPWGALVERPIPLFTHSPHRKYESLRVETDPDDGDGFLKVASADIGGHDIKASGPFADPAACKAACLAHSACLACVWTGLNGCNLKAFSGYTSNPKSRFTVYVRAFKRLHAALPHDMHVTPTLQIPKGAILPLPSSNAGLPAALTSSILRIDMRTDSFRTDGSSADKAHGLGIPNTRAAYLVDLSTPTSNDAGELYESPGWIVGHEVIYTVDRHAPLVLDGPSAMQVGYYTSGYDTTLAGSFSCDVPDLTKLWKKAQRTLFVNMRDNWMDCPDRERSQWWFDVSMDVHQAFYALSPTARQLTRKGIRELAAWQKVGDLSEPYAPMSIYSPVPGHWVDELPNQSLQSIAYGFATYWDHSGDVNTMRAVIPAINRYLLSWSLSKASSGAVVAARSCPGKAHAADVQCAGVWDWCDGQSTNCDYAPIDNAWMFWALNSTVRIARAVKATRVGGEMTAADLSTLEQRAADLKAGFHQTFWDPSCTCYRSSAHRQRVGGTSECKTKNDNCTLPDDRVQALAIVTGLAPRDKWQAIAQGVLDLSSNSSVAFSSTAMEKFALEAMFLAGEHDAALVRMQSRFERMIQHNLSTLWEHWEWDAITGNPIAGYNHGWSGGVLVLLSQYVAGLAPTSPGWTTFDIRPNLGTTLRNVSATVDTEHGEVHVSVQRREDPHVLHVLARVPNGAVATLHFPEKLGRIAGISTEPQLATRQHKGQALELPAGAWRIEARFESGY